MEGEAVAVEGEVVEAEEVVEEEEEEVKYIFQVIVFETCMLICMNSSLSDIL